MDVGAGALAKVLCTYMVAPIAMALSDRIGIARRSNEQLPSDVPLVG